MKSTAKTIEGLANDSIDPILFNEILELIRKVTKEEGTFYEMGKFSGIGFKYKPYKNTCQDTMYPYISITPQKNTINVYVAKYENGKSILNRYTEIFGKSNIGQGCIRLKKLTPERKETLIEILKQVN